MSEGFGGLFAKGGAAEQLLIYNVLGQVLSVALGVPLQLLQREANKLVQATPLTPAQLADMVVRNIIPIGPATQYAKESGIAAADFARMVADAGEGPAPGDLAEALRRGVIPEHGTGTDAVSFEQGIAESHLRNKWIGTIKALAIREPSPEDALNALLQGQIPLQMAKDLYSRFGGDLEHFQWLFDSRGTAPSPVELGLMANRGVIPWDGEGPTVTSFHQGILEGPSRDKWEEVYRKLAEYVVPPRTVTAMVREGSLDDQQALAEYQKSGLSPQMAAAYLTSAHHMKTQPQRDLTTSQVVQLYKDRIIDTAEAKLLLNALKWSDEDVAFLLDVADFEVEQTRVRAGISKIHSLYVAHKIDAVKATTELDAFNVPGAGRDKMIQDWNIERDANTPTLTRAEIVDAVYYEIIDIPTGIAMLQDLGWSADDAAILIGNRFKGKLPAAPSA